MEENRFLNIVGWYGACSVEAVEPFGLEGHHFLFGKDWIGANHNKLGTALRHFLSNILEGRVVGIRFWLA